MQTGYNRILAGVEAACREMGKRLYFQSIGDGAETRSRTAEERPPDALWSEALVDTFWIDCARTARPTCWLTSLSRTRVRPHLCKDRLRVGNSCGNGSLAWSGSSDFWISRVCRFGKVQSILEAAAGIRHRVRPPPGRLLSTMDLQPGIVAGYRRWMNCSKRCASKFPSRSERLRRAWGAREAEDCWAFGSG